MCSRSREGFLLIKTDSLGEQEWKKTFGAQSDTLLSMVQTNDVEFAVFARALTVDWLDPTLIKTDPEGNVLWAKNYLNELAIPWDMIGTHDDGYVLCASEDWTIEEGDPEGEIIKVDAEGNICWVISLVDGSARSIVQTLDGGYALVETRNLRDYDSWQEYYSAVWIIKTEKDPANPIATISPTPTSSPYTPLELGQEAILGVAITAVICAGLGFLVYLIKRK